MVHKWLCRDSQHDECPYQQRVVLWYTSGFALIPSMIKNPTNKGCLMVYKHKELFYSSPCKYNNYTSGFAMIPSMVEEAITIKVQS